MQCTSMYNLEKQKLRIKLSMYPVNIGVHIGEPKNPFT